MTDCGCNLDPEPCAVCARLPSDFYDSEAQQLAAEIAYELFGFSQLRPRREAQAARLWEKVEGWVSTPWLAAHWRDAGPVNYKGMLKRMQRQAGLRRRFPNLRKCETP